MIKIDKDHPLPVKYPFEQMEVGDSFAVPDTVKRTTLSIAMRRYGRKNNKKFTVRKFKDGAYRCWRIE
jgi:hypothetical protein